MSGAYENLLNMLNNVKYMAEHLFGSFLMRGPHGNLSWQYMGVDLKGRVRGLI